MNNPPAFPTTKPLDGWGDPNKGMTLRDWFAGQALVNPAICTGTATEWELTAWFGRNRSGITRAEIVAKQAGSYADAMLASRASEPR